MKNIVLYLLDRNSKLILEITVIINMYKNRRVYILDYKRYSTPPPPTYLDKNKLKYQEGCMCGGSNFFFINVPWDIIITCALLILTPPPPHDSIIKISIYLSLYRSGWR